MTLCCEPIFGFWRCPGGNAGLRVGERSTRGAVPLFVKYSLQHEGFQTRLDSTHWIECCIYSRCLRQLPLKSTSRSSLTRWRAWGEQPSAVLTDDLLLWPDVPPESSRCPWHFAWRTECMIVHHSVLRVVCFSHSALWHRICLAAMKKVWQHLKLGCDLAKAWNYHEWSWPLGLLCFCLFAGDANKCKKHEQKHHKTSLCKIKLVHCWWWLCDVVGTGEQCMILHSTP